MLMLVMYCAYSIHSVCVDDFHTIWILVVRDRERERERERKRQCICTFIVCLFFACTYALCTLYWRQGQKKRSERRTWRKMFRWCCQKVLTHSQSKRQVNALRTPIHLKWQNNEAAYRGKKSDSRQVVI